VEMNGEIPSGSRVRAAQLENTCCLHCHSGVRRLLTAGGSLSLLLVVVRWIPQFLLQGLLSAKQLCTVQ
jgi:hypothetical protein